jgi:CheY-like chemotaxis protein
MHEHFLPDSDLAQVRLLIIEDDPFLQSYLSEILLDYPLQVYIADSLNEAVGYYVNKQPDILLMESYFSFAGNLSIDQEIDKKIVAGNLQLITMTEQNNGNHFVNFPTETISYLTKPLVPGEVTCVVMRLAENIILKKILG